jgi:hypothetical protein
LRSIGNCNVTLGKPYDRVVVAGLVMGCNCSWNVVSVYSGLGKVTYGRPCGDRSAINDQCQSLGFVIVTPREAGSVVVEEGWFL